jgi:hypothetical protein
MGPMNPTDLEGLAGTQHFIVQETSCMMLSRAARAGRADISKPGLSSKVITRILHPRFLLNLAIPALPKRDSAKALLRAKSFEKTFQLGEHQLLVQ